jgi:HAE1 family hydrophobic/amphiphilic exporter-1
LGYIYWAILLNWWVLGLSLVVGILVDDAIVVLENIYRHMEMGKTARAAYDGTAEIGGTVTSIT